MTTLAAAGSISGHIFGTLGAGGAALAITVLLILGVRGKHKISFSQQAASIWGFIAGTLYATAASVWTTPADATNSLVAAVRGGVVGNVGMGAIALIIVLILYGAKLRPLLAALLGIAAATIFGEAGGLWSIPSAVLAGLLNHTLGVA